MKLTAALTQWRWKFYHRNRAQLNHKHNREISSDMVEKENHHTKKLKQENIGKRNNNNNNEFMNLIIGERDEKNEIKYNYCLIGKR